MSQEVCPRLLANDGLYSFDICLELKFYFPEQSMSQIPDWKNLTSDQQQALMDHLAGYLNPDRLVRYDEVLALRTRYITIALEDIYQPHNASATVRSCDLFGLQEMHVIENYNPFTISKGVSRGAYKWVDIHRWNRIDHPNTPDCLEHLKQRGYKVVATTPHQDDFAPDTLPLDQPVVILFGTEHDGVSGVGNEMADAFLRIPMVGFTESFNLSVSVALILYELTTRLRKSNIEWKLDDADRLQLRYQWIRKQIRRVDLIEEKFWENPS